MNIFSRKRIKNKQQLKNTDIKDYLRNILRVIKIKDNKFVAETNKIDGFEYAYFLNGYHGTEKNYYTNDTNSKFMTYVLPGEYEVVFYYRDVITMEVFAFRLKFYVVFDGCEKVICNKERLSYIEDHKQRKMYYKFTPAKKPENSPLLVILHGHTFNAKPSKFRDENWNVLCPVDNFGVDNAGSWWLGENGDYFVKDLLHILIAKTQKQIGKTQGLYFWGSSMGGYGAILHGCLLGAMAVYANIPQIKLLGSSYDKKQMNKFFAPIFGGDINSVYNDVTNFIKDKNTPLFFLVQSQFDYPNYLEEHGLYFLEKCREKNVNISFEIVPNKGHKTFYSIAESVAKLERFMDLK